MCDLFLFFVSVITMYIVQHHRACAQQTPNTLFRSTAYYAYLDVEKFDDLKKQSIRRYLNK